jgi:hypothetical protein
VWYNGQMEHRPESVKAYNDQFGARNARKYYKANRERIRKQTREHRFELRLKLLTHYGKDGKLQCCWPDCGVVDPDILTLDHINNDGAKERRETGKTGGLGRYYHLVKDNFPGGYQTLCWNHQWKKEMARRRLSIPA